MSVDDDARTSCASSSRAAPTTPGSRAVSCDMALKRWVKPRRPMREGVAMSRRRRVGVAGADDHAGLRQARRSLRSGTISGASVDQRRAAERRRSSSIVGVVDRAQLGRVVDALRGGIEERPFDVDAEHAGHAGRDRARAPLRAPLAILAASSLIRVGRKPVVPKRRCAAPIAAIVSTLGSSLNSRRRRH